jgi:hypothetical protein
VRRGLTRCSASTMVPLWECVNLMARLFVPGHVRIIRKESTSKKRPQSEAGETGAMQDVAAGFIGTNRGNLSHNNGGAAAEGDQVVDPDCRRPACTDVGRGARRDPDLTVSRGHSQPGAHYTLGSRA